MAEKIACEAISGSADTARTNVAAPIQFILVIRLLLTTIAGTRNGAGRVLEAAPGAPAGELNEPVGRIRSVVWHEGKL